jgi:hypothetical protein
MIRTPMITLLVGQGAHVRVTACVCVCVARVIIWWQWDSVLSMG